MGYLQVLNGLAKILMRLYNDRKLIGGVTRRGQDYAAKAFGQAVLMKPKLT